MGARIEGAELTFEGKAPVPLDVALAAAEKRPAIMRTQYVPPGVRAVYRCGNEMVLVHESMPGARTMKWIREDSPEPDGPGAKYRTVRISLPFTLSFVLLSRLSSGLWAATGGNEAFFSLEPFGPSVPIFYPALLNVSKFPAEFQESRSLAWICTANYKFRNLSAKDAAKSDAESKSAAFVVQQVVENLLLAGFNYSSEKHEGQSWYSETAQVEKRISTISKWESLTEKDPMGGLSLKYIPVKKTADEIAERIFRLHSSKTKGVSTEAALSIAVANEGNKSKVSPEPEPEEEEEE